MIQSFQRMEGATDETTVGYMHWTRRQPGYRGLNHECPERGWHHVRLQGVRRTPVPWRRAPLPAAFACFAAGFVGAALATGCVQNNAFNPLGRDVSLAFDWTLEGATPTPDTCREAGIGDVQLIFIEDVPGTPRRFDFNPQACELGAFDSRAFRTAEVLDAGEKLIQWRALDRRGFVLFLGEPDRHSPNADNHIDLGTFAL